MADETLGETQFNRRYTDHSESQSIKSNITFMAEMMKEMKDELKAMRADLSKIAIHDEKIMGLMASQDRTSDDIKLNEEELKKVNETLNKKVDEHIRNTDKAHETYNRFIWMASGIGLTLTILWTLGGWYFIETFKRQSELNQEIILHLHDAEQIKVN